jgi:hypothetical protein
MTSFAAATAVRDRRQQAIRMASVFTAGEVYQKVAIGLNSSRPALPVPVVELEIGWHVPGIEVSVVRHQRGPDIQRGSGGEKVDPAL